MQLFRHISLFLLSILLGQAPFVYANEPYISEIVAANDNSLRDDFGDSSDWIEIYNGGEVAVSLEGLSLATRRDFSDRTGLTGSVPAGGTTVIDVNIESRGQMPFLLLNGDIVMQAISPGRPDVAGSAQAFPDGSDEWFIVSNSTRGRGNNEPPPPARAPARPATEVLARVTLHLFPTPRRVDR